MKELERTKQEIRNNKTKYHKMQKEREKEKQRKPKHTKHKTREKKCESSQLLSDKNPEKK